MKSTFNIKHLAAVLCLFSSTLAYSSFTLPPLSTDDEKLAFLLQVRKEIPKLFIDAAKYDIDLFSLLDNEVELVAQLKKYPKFEELYSDKKYININVKPTGNIWVGQVEIKPDAIKNWKDSILKKIHIVKESFSTPATLLAEITTKDILSLDPLDVLNKIGRIEAKGKAKKEQIEKFKNQNTELAKCKRIPELIKKFQCMSENYGDINELPNLPLKEDIDRIVTGLSHEEKVFPQLYLAALLKKNLNMPVPQDWDQFKDSIAQLNGEDLIYLNDKNDVLKPILVTYFDKEDDLRLLRALDFIHKEINKYASDTISKQTLVTSEVELMQVPPQIGIFRGCIGGDCSSQFSFPYPNDPHERVFYIKTKKLKGYVSTTEVIVGEEKTLYVITISGAHVSAEDVELIFRGFEKAKETLGVKHIILPTLDNLAGLINFPAIKRAYENHISKSNRSVELVYQDKEIRNEIERYTPSSGYNSANYDHSDKNKNGMVLLIKNNNPVEVNITERLLAQDNSFSKEDLFEFIRELITSERIDIIYKISNTQTAKTAFGEDWIGVIDNLFGLLDSCGDSDILNIQEFKKQINNYLISLGLGENYLNNNPYLMIPGYLKCQDAFSRDNLEEAAMLVANDIKNNEYKSALFSLIKNHKIELNTTDAFNKLNDHYYKKLNNPNAEIRETAIKIFSKIKPSDQKIHKALTQALFDGDRKVRKTAVKALEMIKPINQEILLEFADLLKHEDKEVRSTAAEALGALKPADPEIHKALVQALVDADSSVRQAAANALGAIKPADPEIHKALVQALVDADSSVRKAAANALGAIKPADSEIHRALAQALSDDDRIVRFVVFEALIEIKPTNQEILLEIADLLKHENRKVRVTAAKTLRAIKPADPEIHRALAQALGDVDSQVRSIVFKALAEIKPTNQESLLEIADLLKHENRGFRLTAANALEALKPADPEIHRALAQALSDDEWMVRSVVFRTLEKIKPTNQESLLEIADLLKHENKEVRSIAAEILGVIKPADPEILKALAQALSDDEWQVRNAATKAIRAINPMNIELILEIGQLLKYSNKIISAFAANILEKITLTNQEILLKIADLLKHKDAQVRSIAAVILEDLKPADPEIHKALAQALGDVDSQVRSVVFRTLEKIKPTNQESLLEIADLLKHENKEVRSIAAEILGVIKPADPEIHRALAQALSDDDWIVRNAAANVLRALKPADPEIHRALAHQALSDDNGIVRDAAANALRAIKAADTKL